MFAATFSPPLLPSPTPRSTPPNPPPTRSSPTSSLPSPSRMPRARPALSRPTGAGCQRSTPLVPRRRRPPLPATLRRVRASSAAKHPGLFRCVHLTGPACRSSTACLTVSPFPILAGWGVPGALCSSTAGGRTSSFCPPPSYAWPPCPPLHPACAGETATTMAPTSERGRRRDGANAAMRRKR
nr:leucine-rich repeat extensin-like protein 5 [Lolium perenne]